MKATSDSHPRWIEESPPSGSYRSIFKWGAENVFKHPNSRMVELLKEKLDMSDADFSRTRGQGLAAVKLDRPPGLSSEQIEVLRGIVGKENVARDDYSRCKYSMGKTTEEAMMLRKGIVPTVADLVVHPRSRDDVAAIVAYCNEQRIAVQPYGGGSSVTFGLRPDHGGVVLVMHTYMNRVLELNEANQTATVEPGLLGPAYERALNEAPAMFGARHRYTCGHFPQSFEFSSVGGWIVTLGSGQQSSYFGDMYDLVVSQEYVTPAGSFKTMPYPAAATGPKVNDIMKGSEGSFGVLVSATLKIFRFMPENRKRFAYLFPSWDRAVAAAREISQSEFGMPSVFRISDPEETETGLKLYGIDRTAADHILRLRGLKPMKRSLFVGTADGEKRFAANIKRQVGRICKRFGATYLTGYPVKQWERSRYTDPYMREDLMDFGIVIDTLESSVTWDNFTRLYEGVRKFIKSRPHTICLTHGSHFYSQGANLYFIFLLRAEDLEEYRSFHGKIIDEIEKHGGSLSHHHGIGKMMAPWMDRHLGPVQMGALRCLKSYFDPGNIMNPGGTLGLEPPGASLRAAAGERSPIPGGSE